MVKNKEVVGTILVFITAFFSGFSIFANKIFVAQIDPLIFTALRGLFIGVAFLILSYAIMQKGDKNKEKGKIKRKINKVSWYYLLAIGFIGGGVAFWLFFSGLQLTTSSRAGFIHKTLPIYVTLLAFIFLKEKISNRQWIALGLMIGGLLTMLLTSIPASQLWANPNLGDLLILGATVLWGIENVIAKKAMIKGENNFVVSFARMFYGSLILFAIALIAGKINLILTLNPLQWLYVISSTILLFMYVLTFYWGIKLINVSKAATILIISPVITLILGIVFLNEPAPFWQIVGSCLILVGSYFIATSKSEISEGVRI